MGRQPKIVRVPCKNCGKLISDCKRGRTLHFATNQSCSNAYATFTANEELIFSDAEDEDSKSINPLVVLTDGEKVQNDIMHDEIIANLNELEYKSSNDEDELSDHDDISNGSLSDISFQYNEKTQTLEETHFNLDEYESYLFFDKTNDHLTDEIESTNDKEYNNKLMKLLMEQRERITLGSSIAPMPADIHYSVLLLSILKRAKAPLFLFDEIQQWCRKVNKECPNYFEGTHKTRNFIIEQLEHRYNLEGYRPKTVKVKLPSSNIVDIVTHDVEHALFSLLNDDDLMQKQNLLLNLDEPWQPLDEKGICGDLHTGSLYRDGWKIYCNN